MYHRQNNLWLKNYLNDNFQAYFIWHAKCLTVLILTKMNKKVLSQHMSQSSTPVKNRSMLYIVYFISEVKRGRERSKTSIAGSSPRKQKSSSVIGIVFNTLIFYLQHYWILNTIIKFSYFNWALCKTRIRYMKKRGKS